MTHEWKVGDRFNRTITVSTDYEITRIDEKFVYLSDGKNIVIWPLFYLDDVTPLIPATPEPQKPEPSWEDGFMMVAPFSQNLKHLGVQPWSNVTVRSARNDQPPNHPKAVPSVAQRYQRQPENPHAGPEGDREGFGLGDQGVSEG